jgi:FkbM family methyltransferase
MRYFNLVRNLSNWWLHLGVKFGLTAVDPLLFRTRRGILIEVPRRLIVEFKEIFMSEAYMRGRKFSLGENPVVLDIGANIGFFTLFALSRLNGARVFSYEPMPVNFRQLRRNVQMNAGHPVTCFQKAVAGQSGNITLHCDSCNEYSTTATVYEPTGQNGETITVEGVSLLDVFRENGLERCDLLKMDCEGAEFEILYNCPQEIMDRIANIAMEVHGGPEDRQNIDSLEDYLNRMGFTTQRYPRKMLMAWRSQSSRQ